MVRTEAKAYAKKEVVKQREEFRKLGVMADWENQTATYRTIGSLRCLYPSYRANRHDQTTSTKSDNYASFRKWSRTVGVTASL